MRKIIVYSLLAIVVFAAFLIARFPANQALAIAQKQSQGMVMAYNATGTLWQGKAEHIYISVNNQLIDLGQTQWSLSFWNLLRAKLALQLDAKNRQQVIKATILASRSELTLTDAEIKLPIAQVMQFVPLPLPIQLRGELELTLQSAQVNTQGVVSQLKGNLIARETALVWQNPIQFGTYAARLDLADGYVLADVVDLDALVAVSGLMKAHLQKREYDTELVIKPTAQADEIIGQTLPMLAKKQNDGSFVFKQNGQF